MSIGNEVEKLMYKPLGFDSFPDRRVFFERLRTSLVLKSELLWFATKQKGHDSVVVLSVAIVRLFVARTNFSFALPGHERLRLQEAQMNSV